MNHALRDIIFSVITTMLKFLSAGLIVISGLSKSFSVVDLKLLRLFFFLGGISVTHKTSEIQQLVYRVRDTLGQYNFLHCISYMFLKS